MGLFVRDWRRCQVEYTATRVLWQVLTDPQRPACLPWWLRRYSVCLQCRRPGFDVWVRKILWRRKWQPTPILCLENSKDEGAW